MKVKVVSGRNIPGCVSGVVPAANIICGLKQQTFNSPSVVSHNPIWNYVAEFKDINNKKDLIKFVVRDADQIIGSTQVPVKNVSVDTINTQFLEMLDNQSSPCSISFLISNDAKSNSGKKRLLERTKKIKDTVLSRFGSDTDLANSKVLSSDSSSGKVLNQNSKPVNNRGIRRCHSYVNERTRNPKCGLTRHQYVNCPKTWSSEMSENAVKNSPLKDDMTPKKMLLVLVQGRNLGIGQSDILSVTIGGVDCTSYIQHCTTEKLLVRVPRGTSLSPVAVVTKSGGIGQQNARVKVTYESSSSSDELKSLQRSKYSEEGLSNEIDKFPFQCESPDITRHRSNKINRKDGGQCNSCGSSESGSDGLCVNTPPRSSLLPSSRRRSSSCSFSSDKSSHDPESSSSSVSREFRHTSGDTLAPKTPLKATSVFQTPGNDFQTPGYNFNSSRSAFLTPSIRLPPVEDKTPSFRTEQASESGSFLTASGKVQIVSLDPSSGIIAPPDYFSEGSSPQPCHKSLGDSPISPQYKSVEEELYGLTKTQLIQEILRLRESVTNLTMTVQTLSQAT